MVHVHRTNVFVTNIPHSLWGGHLISKGGKIQALSLHVKRLSQGLWACSESQDILDGLLVSRKEGRALLCSQAGAVSVDLESKLLQRHLVNLSVRSA